VPGLRGKQEKLLGLKLSVLNTLAEFVMAEFTAGVRALAGAPETEAAPGGAMRGR